MENYRLLLVPAVGGGIGYLVAKHYNKSVVKGVIIGAALSSIIVTFVAVQALKKMT